MKYCIYCTRMTYDGYACQCNLSQVICSSCDKKFKCDSCKKQRVKIQFSQCKCCKEQFNKNNMIVEGDYSTYRFCFRCCRQINEKKDHIYRSYLFGSKSYSGSYKRSDPQKRQQQVKLFLRKFCNDCGKAKKQGKGLAIREDDELKDGKCVQCKQKQDAKLKMRYAQNQKHVDPIQMSQLIKKKMEKMESETKQRERQKLVNIWKAKLNLVYLKCLSCQRRIFTLEQKEAFLTEDIVLCKICSIESKYGEEQYKISSQVQRDESKLKPEKGDVKKYENVIDNYNRSKVNIQGQNNVNNSRIKEKLSDSKIKEFENINISKKKEQKEESDLIVLVDVSKQQQNLPQIQKSKISIKQFQELDISEIKVKQSKPKGKINLSKNISDSVVKQKNIAESESRLKRITSDAQLTHFKINLALAKDQQFVQCKFCCIEIQAIDSIWEEDQNVPLCKCCMADFITKNEREFQRKQNNDRLAKTDAKQHKRLENQYKYSSYSKKQQSESQKKKDWSREGNLKNISQLNQKQKIAYPNQQNILKLGENDIQKQQQIQKNPKPIPSPVLIPNSSNQPQNRSKTISKQSNVAIRPLCSHCKKKQSSQKYSNAGTLLCLECRSDLSMKSKNSSLYPYPYLGGTSSLSPYYNFRR